MDYRVEQGWSGDPKRRRLKRRLGAEGVLALMDLWEFCANETHERTDGDLTGMTHEDIADAAGWDGDASAFVGALLDCRLVDGIDGHLQIHDWAVHQPFVVNFLKRSAAGTKGANERWHKKDRSTECASHADRIETDATGMRSACDSDAVSPKVDAPLLSSPSSPSSPTKDLRDDATPSPAALIASLEACYPDGLATETRNACALSRQSGTMSDAKWLVTLRKLEPHPVGAVVAAMRTFCDQYADGQKDERYLLGIVRGNLKPKIAKPAAATGIGAPVYRDPAYDRQYPKLGSPEWDRAYPPLPQPQRVATLPDVDDREPEQEDWGELHAPESEATT